MAQAAPVPSSRRRIAALVAVSGASALVYQSLWLRSFGLVFGNTTEAVALVLATFMGGLALGSALAARRPADHPLRAYARVELAIGLSALMTVPLLRLLPAAYGALAGRAGLDGVLDLAVRSLASALILLPTTILMGLAVPLAVAHLALEAGGLRASFGRLYLANTFGGAVGVALAPFVLLPALGVSGTLVAAAAGNLLAGATARRMALEAAGPGRAAARADGGPGVPAAVLDPVLPARAALTLAFVSGAFTFAIEVLWTRSFALVIGSSVYAFHLMLLAVLIGLAGGTLAHERFRERIARPARVLGAALAAAGASSLLGAIAIGRLPDLFFALMKGLPVSFGAHQAASFALCLAVMLPVTLLLGLTFPLLAWSAASAAAQATTGRLYAWNTAGALAGALGAGFVLVPGLGLQGSFGLLAGLLALAGAAVLVWTARLLPQARLAVVAAVAIAAAFATGLRTWDPLVMTSGVYRYGLEWRERAGFAPRRDLAAERRLVFYAEGREAVVAVAERPGSGRRFLSVNGKTDAGSGAEDVLTQRFIAHVPLLLHPAPRSVLVVGWGAGATVASAARHPVERLECVEIEPATWRAAPLFDALSREVRRDPRFRIVFRDGRNHLLRSGARWDAIVSEPSNPWISGVSNLFTRDFYAVARERLAPGGVFGQWFHYYNLDPLDVKVELATFAAVFPHVSLWLVPPLGAPEAGSLTADLLLVGSREPHALDPVRLRAAMAGPIGDDLRSTGVIRDEAAVIAAWTMDRDTLLRWTADPAFPRGTPLNTDDHPWIELRAPRRNVLVPDEVARVARELYLSLGESGAGLVPPLRAADGRAAAPSWSALAERYQQVLLPGRAIDAAQRAVDADPADAASAERLATLLLDRRDFRQAEEAHLRLLTLRPRDVDAWLRLAAIQARQSKWTAARDALRRALAIEPKAPVDPALLDYVERQATGAAEARPATSR
jgi:spermidine synthase